MTLASRVALVGTCPSSRMLAPYRDPSWQIWACSPDNAFGRIPRVDVWFEIHGDLEWSESVEWGAPKYFEWLKQQEFPVYAQDQSVIPNALTFPRDELARKFGRYFFTSSFAYMFAFAMQQGAKEIGLWGIDMEVASEYAHQRPALQHFIWLAGTQSIKVLAPDESSIFQPPAFYGYIDATPMGRKLAVRRRELEGRIQGMKAERDKLDHNITFLEGALEDLEWVHDTWTNYIPPEYATEQTKIVRLASPSKIKKEA